MFESVDKHNKNFKNSAKKGVKQEFWKRTHFIGTSRLSKNIQSIRFAYPRRFFKADFYERKNQKAVIKYVRRQGEVYTGKILVGGV